jgi:HTH-type transcriptional regulator / antitoxin HigA
MEQKGLAPRDLVPFIGGRNRVHEVLSRKRPLTLPMIQRLHAGLGIAAESLIEVGRHKAAYHPPVAPQIRYRLSLRLLET